MAITSAGYFGAVNDVQWAQLFEPFPYWCRPTSYAPSVVGGQRRISLTAGVGFGGGVRDTSSAASPVDLGAPSSGGIFYLVVLRHTWNPNVGGTTTIVGLVGSTTDGTPPTVPPTTIPTDLKTTPGTQYDTPIAWVHVRAADTTLTVFDVRMLITSAGIGAGATPAALGVLSAIAPVVPGTRIACASTGLNYRYTGGTTWVPQPELGSDGWAPTWGGSGAAIGDNGGTNGSVVKLGNHVFYSGRVAFGSSATAGDAVITGVNDFGTNDLGLSHGRGYYRQYGGARWAVVLAPQTASEFVVLVVRDSGLAALSSLGAIPQSSELFFDIHAVLA